MKKFIMALVATMTMSVMTFAGGDIAPVEEPAIAAPVTKDFYVGGHWTANQAFVDGDRSWFEDDDRLAYGLGGQVGYTFFRSGDFTTAVEGRVTYTFMGDADGSEFWTGDVMLKPGYAFGDFGVYALAGYTYTDFDIDNFGDDTVDGFVWGGGAQYAINDTVEVFADYTVRPEIIKDVVNNEVITIGFNYKF